MGYTILSTLLKKYNYSIGNIHDRSLGVFSTEVNAVFQLPKIVNNSNAGNVFLRYRLYDDVNSNVKSHHQFLIGYSTNLRSMIKN